MQIGLHINDRLVSKYGYFGSFVTFSESCTPGQSIKYEITLCLGLGVGSRAPYTSLPPMVSDRAR